GRMKRIFGNKAAHQNCLKVRSASHRLPWRALLSIHCCAKHSPPCALSPSLSSWSKSMSRKLLEEVVKHEHPPPFQMIYVGKYSGELSKSFAERIMAYASVDSDAYLFLKKAFNVKVASSNEASVLLLLAMKKVHPQLWLPEVVADEEGRKHFSTWEDITDSCDNFCCPKSRLYSELQKLTEQPQESNVKLLRALFDSEESRTSSIFVRNYTENMGVDELHGKTVLLLISDMVEHPFQSLKEIYSKINTNDDIEILSIPIPAK
ncbi:hypothetical protein KI387_043216, partial [Taxus chinensis]